MTDNQKNIIGTILLNMSASTLPVTEEMISNVQACEAQGLSVKGIKEETIWIVQD